MEFNDIRSAMTVIMFVLFLAIVFWAYSRKRKRDFDEAARLPFEEEEPMVSAEARKVSSKEHGAQDK
ncbi:MAG: cbb3-type cytochrome c oxidase subunit 3 [Burkholderiales bacterium]|nr:cbb3-type cytochrome c oxidase subunit 3 [Burkholderiales bacterium]